MKKSSTVLPSPLSEEERAFFESVLERIIMKLETKKQFVILHTLQVLAVSQPVSMGLHIEEVLERLHETFGPNQYDPDMVRCDIFTMQGCGFTASYAGAFRNSPAGNKFVAWFLDQAETRPELQVFIGHC